jgi:acyl carrier protein
MTTRLGDAMRERLERQGLSFVSPDEGIALLERALGARHAAVAAFPFDGKRFRTALGNAPVPALLRELAPRDADHETGDLPKRLLALPTDARAAELRTALQQEVGVLLGLSPADVPTDQALQSLGFDSLMAVDLRNRVAARMGRAIAATFAFNFPSVDEQVDHLLTLLPAASDAAPPPSSEAARPEGLSTEEMARLSEEEAIARLEAELSQLPKDLD